MAKGGLVLRMSSFLQKVIDRYTPSELVDLMDISIEDCVEALADLIQTDHYYEIIAEDLGINPDDEDED